MYYIQPADRQQYQMMSSLDDLVRKEHPVRIMDVIIESVVLSNPDRFNKEMEKKVGRPGYSDRTMLKLYLYGYFTGISSSRKLEVETHRNIELIWLLGGLRPDHWTISNYRKENGESIKFITKKFREYLKNNGYIKLKTVGIDGSKIKANTNREMLTEKKIEKKLKGLDKKIEEYIQRIAEADKIDESIDEIEEYGYETASKKYIDKIIELQKEVERLQENKEILEKEGRKYISPTDKEARLMKSREGMIPAYNVQIVVDAENKMIADSEVVTDEADNEMLPIMIGSIKEELLETPKEILADNGYNQPDSIEEVEKSEDEINIYVSQEQVKKEKDEVEFEYDEQADEYKCSEGKRLVLIQTNKKKNKSLTNVYRGIECNGCRLFGQCTKSQKGRMIHRYLNQEWRDGYKKKMQSKFARNKLKIRRELVEHPFGTIKCLMGKIPLLLRGVKKAAIEINLYTTVYNLKRLINIISFEKLFDEIKNYNWKIA